MYQLNPANSHFLCVCRLIIMSSLMDIFTQVTFTDIHECYYCQKDVECQFAVSPVLKPDSNDIVGIYKVGWKSTNEFFCHKSISVPTDFNPETSFRASVMFTGNYGALLFMDVSNE